MPSPALRPHAPANWSVALTQLLGDELSSTYSVRLYGAQHRTPIADLKVLWLDLLSDESVNIIARIGICGLHSKFSVLPFYSPALVPGFAMMNDPDSRLAGDSQDTVWVGAFSRLIGSSA